MFQLRLRDVFIALSFFGLAALVAALATDVPVWYKVLGAGCFIVGFAGIMAAIAEGQFFEPVDVWSQQRRIMEMSGQRTPDAPEINETAFLYVALTLEELAETSAQLAETLQRVAPYSSLGDHTKRLATWMTAQSTDLRTVVAKTNKFSLPISRDEAVEILDGTTDTMVTTAGLGVALGLPCAEGYVEVQDSNASKANPDTGVIDKEPSGKWIKGPKYRKPDLQAVLDRQPIPGLSS